VPDRDTQVLKSRDTGCDQHLVNGDANHLARTGTTTLTADVRHEATRVAAEEPARLVPDQCPERGAPEWRQIGECSALKRRTGDFKISNAGLTGAGRFGRKPRDRLRKVLR
jgi:hypothetical protein